MKSGFVNIVGNPNVGKCTLMNRLVGERISIITSKAQTTRHRIMGIVNGRADDNCDASTTAGGLTRGSGLGDFQIVYSDTPGILRPGYRLQESMMRQVRGAVEDADVILYVTDTVESSFISTHQPISRQRDADAALTADEKARIVQSGTDSPTRQGSAAGALRSREIVEKIRQSSVPTIVVINKIDLSTPEKVMAMVEGWTPCIKSPSPNSSTRPTI